MSMCAWWTPTKARSSKAGATSRCSPSCSRISPAHYVVLQDYVTVEDGSGLVHTAPAFGAEDMQAAIEYDLPVLMTVADDGTFIPEVRPWSGKFVKDADPLIIEDLQTPWPALPPAAITHTYPFCWRCDTPLLYYARSTWYIRTSQFKERLSALNQADQLGARAHQERALRQLAGEQHRLGPGPRALLGHPAAGVGVRELPPPARRRLGCRTIQHWPGATCQSWTCTARTWTRCTSPARIAVERMQRVPELIDVWFDSGSMPVAQWHYPLRKPGDVQAAVPRRLHLRSRRPDPRLVLFAARHQHDALRQRGFQECDLPGVDPGWRGRKMSKSPRQYRRSLGCAQHRTGQTPSAGICTPPRRPGRSGASRVDLVGEVVRNFTLTLWNVYSFFVTYANLDGWTPDQNRPDLASKTTWTAGCSRSCTPWCRKSPQRMENYDVPGATRPIQAFVDDLSKWYLRRSRRRFWKSGADADKRSAYATLYETLVTLSKLLAPSMPFLADALYQNLVRSAGPERARIGASDRLAASRPAGDRPGFEPVHAAGDAPGFAGACCAQPGQPQGAPAAGRSSLFDRQRPRIAGP